MFLKINYYSKRAWQKIFPMFDFKIPFRDNSLAYISNPPGSVYKFAANEDGFEDLKVIIKLLNVDDVFFDIGANFGMYTLAVHDKFGKNVDIHCFEPEHDAFRRLSQSRLLNKAKWELNKFALGEQNGWTRITNSLGGYNHIVQSGSEGDLIPVMTLDEYLLQSQIKKVKVVKIDVEGFELFVLKGAKNALKDKTFENIIFEVDDHQKRYSVKAEDYKELLENYGYSIKRESSNFQLWSVT
jgi:FkbM family methyltransferase